MNKLYAILYIHLPNVFMFGEYLTYQFYKNDISSVIAEKIIGPCECDEGIHFELDWERPDFVWAVISKSNDASAESRGKVRYAIKQLKEEHRLKIVGYSVWIDDISEEGGSNE